VGHTLLIGNPRASWREWLRENRGRRDLLCLDPADPQQGIPGRLALFHEEHPIATRLYGALDAQRAPHVILAALAQFLPLLGEDGIVQLFAYRPTPLLRQVAALAALLVDPEEILIATGTDFHVGDLPVGPSEIEIEPAFPPMVQHAQRKAQWLRLIEECVPHDVDLAHVTVEGARFGSGKSLTKDERGKAGLEDAVYAERCGNALLVVAEEEPEERFVSRAMDVTGTTRIHFVEPAAYDNLLLSFARPNGEEIGFGFVRAIDWESRMMVADCSAVPPATVRILRLGGLRVDRNGRELGELKPWQV